MVVVEEEVEDEQLEELQGWLVVYQEDNQELEVSMLPDLPPKGNFRHIVREGTTGKKATLFACPHPRKTEDCVKLNEHQRKIISNGDPYSGV